MPVPRACRHTAAVTRTRIASGSPFEPTIGFSRALRVGDRVLVSGTTPVFPDGSCPDGAADQARRCFAIIGAALAEAGASFADVVRSRVLLTDVADAEAVSAVHGEVYGDVRPAATMVAVAALLDPRWRVEIEAEAVVADRRERDEREFVAVDDLPWQPAGDGVEERVLSRGPGPTLTRVTRWRPGLDTSAAGVIRHDFHEEVYLLEGDLHDLTLGATFGPGHYASRRPGMPHGPYRTDTGCVMLEVRNVAPITHGLEA
jgi:enamine deaminase RidA (YjgF/YER057c/UK114 family)